MIGYIDDPSANSIIYSTTIVCRGWVYSELGIGSIKIIIDDCEVGEAEYGLQRNDVKTVFPQYSDIERSGFFFSKNLPLVNGSHRLKVTVYEKNGNMNDLGEVAFNLTSKSFFNANVSSIFTRFFCKKTVHLPNKELQLAIGDGYEAVGKEFFHYFISFGEVKPEEKILDVGCGCGRMAVPLTMYLHKPGYYRGFDISREAIDWCKKNITSAYPHFLFEYADIFNKEYNEQGVIASKKYTFPYADNTFDFIFLTSVFTHLLPEDMEHYFSEISRTLKSGGRCLITFFLLNEESRTLMNEKPQVMNFRYGEGEYRVIDPTTPERAISFEESYIRQLYAKNNLRIQDPVHYGSWCGRSSFLSFQDIIICIKKEA